MVVVVMMASDDNDMDVVMVVVVMMAGDVNDGDCDGSGDDGQ